MNDLAVVTPSVLPVGKFEIEDFDFSPTYLKPRDNFDLNQWERLGQFIRLTNQACQFWWGDWLNMGEESFGEKASQALEPTGWDVDTLQVYSWVCKKVPAESRITGVTFSHYQLLAKYPLEFQQEWAQRVVSENMSVRGLRYALKELKEPTKQDQPCILIRCKNDADADTVEALLPENVKDTCVIERVRRKMKA